MRAKTRITAFKLMNNCFTRCPVFYIKPEKEIKKSQWTNYRATINFPAIYQCNFRIRPACSRYYLVIGKELVWREACIEYNQHL